MKATRYFEEQVLRKRPYIRREWCERAGVVLDFDAEGHLVGIDIDQASRVVNLSRLEAEALPTSRVLLTRP